MGDNNKNAKIGRVIKNLLLKNHRARKAQIYMKASQHSADSSLFKSWSLEVRWGHRENIFHK
jgi:hypothetical protein